MKRIITSGKRKKAIATATLVPGAGNFFVNGNFKAMQFPLMYRHKIMEPGLIAPDVAGKVDIHINVHGGGINSQSEATRLAISRAMVQFDKKLERVFLDYDRQLLVADVRAKEARKPNTHGKPRAKRQKSYR